VVAVFAVTAVEGLCRDRIGGRYDCSGHFLWCGERTRELDGAHLEFLRGIGNPLGVKISNKMAPSDLVTLIAAVNPENVPGRLAVIVRMGAQKVIASPTSIPFRFY
jgi:3-deoxy-7-phosphoheptulonate synthase